MSGRQEAPRGTRPRAAGPLLASLGPASHTHVMRRTSSPEALDAPFRRTYRPKAKPTPQPGAGTHQCMAPGCALGGDYRAPKARDLPERAPDGSASPRIRTSP